MKPRHFLIVTALSAGLLYCGQLVFPLGIPMGDDFSRAQEDQGSNARPKIKVLPPVSACDGFPSRYPGHAEWPPIIFFCRDAFLVSDLVSDRRLKRLKRIWNGGLIIISRLLRRLAGSVVRVVPVNTGPLQVSSFFRERMSGFFCVLSQL